MLRHEGQRMGHGGYWKNAGAVTGTETAITIFMSRATLALLEAVFAVLIVGNVGHHRLVADIDCMLDLMHGHRSAPPQRQTAVETERHEQQAAQQERVWGHEGSRPQFQVVYTTKYHGQKVGVNRRST